MRLPEEFARRMQRLLGAEYEAYLQSLDEPRKYGLRVNTWKITPEAFEEIAPFHLTPISWIPGAYSYEKEDAVSRHPFYRAGLYYLQEPSAMIPASILNAMPGEKVLDLCAAPGGKATAIGAALKGEGLLVANDVSMPRAKALLQNLEMFGIRNAFVTNTQPVKLLEQFKAYFDAVLVDAPCSGEGMFRKDEAAVRAWTPDKPEKCAAVQKAIILQAADMLRPGGRMVYSTCTFSPLEDEAVIAHLLRERPDMRLCAVPEREGFGRGLTAEELKTYLQAEGTDPGEHEELNGSQQPELEKCVRLWPHKTGGEGHFVALLEKRPHTEEEPVQQVLADTDALTASELKDSVEPHSRIPAAFSEKTPYERNRSGRKQDRKGQDGKRQNGRTHPGKKQSAGGGGERADKDAVMNFLNDCGIRLPEEYCDRLEIRQTRVCLSAPIPEEVIGIPFLRNGLYLGEMKKGRFEPSQSFAMTLQAENCGCTLNLEQDDERLMRYMQGETVILSAREAAGSSKWRLVCVQGYPIGWGTCNGTLLKNKYLAGWRIR